MYCILNFNTNVFEIILVGSKKLIINNALQLCDKNQSHSEIESTGAEQP